MADENRNELNAIVSIMGDVLLELQGIRTDQKAMAETQATMARAFDRSMTLVVDKLTSIDTKIEQYGQQLGEIKQIKERLLKLEEIVLRNSA